MIGKNSTGERPLSRWERFMDRWMSEPERRREREAARLPTPAPTGDHLCPFDDCA